MPLDPPYVQSASLNVIERQSLLGRFHAQQCIELLARGPMTEFNSANGLK
jgi:hypothetical protein